jgi:FtsP/CotA-like multicopper oxidase with cupredoxin domain
MLELSRRRLLAATSALPVATGLLPLASPGKASPARPTEDPWERGAKLDFVLSIARHEMAPFGTPIEALLVGGTWPGTTIRYQKGDRFRVLVENALDQPTSLHWHGLVCPNLEDGVPTVTQAPIAPGDALYYEFALEQAGTFLVPLPLRAAGAAGSGRSPDHRRSERAPCL